MIIKLIARELGISPKQVENTVKLLDDGNTIPFIARYRKEATGELDENVIRDIAERLTYLRNLEARKEEVIRIIAEQEKLSPELEAAVRAATKLQEVEDLYRPYRPKRRTRASIAREKGMEPLAEIMLAQEMPADASAADFIEAAAITYVNLEAGVATMEEALAGARDIIAETVADDADTRKTLRRLTFQKGQLVTRAKNADKETAPVYEMYYEYREPVNRIPPHRVLAVNRGEREEILAVKIEVAEEDMLVPIRQKWVKNNGSPWSPHVDEAIRDAYKRLIEPAIERDIRNELTEKSEEQAIKVFSANLRNLLLQPPVGGKTVLGIDPGFRTGCKLAVVDDTGRVLDVGVMYPHPPQNKREEAKKVMAGLIERYGAGIITIGNGTACRETENVVAELIREMPGREVFYTIVSEAGASVYSASKVAGEEFPQYDLSLRSAVSIARRLQDPLAELVKIEPKAIGVGQYQHDVNARQLAESLHGVVESCVNSVGVDLNTASPSLLQYVAGLKPAVAKSIVAFREANGRFRLRAELKKVPRLGEQTFIQCAGFIRLPGGANPLENTPVHPESYQLAEAILKQIGYGLADLNPARLPEIREKMARLNIEELAAGLGAGVPTVRDIVEALQKPGRDPREELPKPVFHREVTSLENLKPGMVLNGIVRNVVDFGAFVDIGVKHDGLVHISQLSDKFVKHPMEVVAVGDNVRVRVLSVDLQRERVSLSMKDTGQGTKEAGH